MTSDDLVVRPERRDGKILDGGRGVVDGHAADGGDRRPLRPADPGHQLAHPERDPGHQQADAVPHARPRASQNESLTGSIRSRRRCGLPQIALDGQAIRHPATNKGHADDRQPALASRPEDRALAGPGAGTPGSGGRLAARTAPSWPCCSAGWPGATRPRTGWSTRSVAGHVFGIARSVLRDPAQAEEVAQEVLLEVWRDAARFDASRGSAMAWVMTLAHRRAVDRVRSEQASADREQRAARADISYDVVAETVSRAARRRAGPPLPGLAHRAAAGVDHPRVLPGLHLP